jgi:hypothetical protein
MTTSTTAIATATARRATGYDAMATTMADDDDDDDG